MRKTKAVTVPDVRVLKDFMEEYQDMMRDAQQGVKSSGSPPRNREVLG